MARIRRLTALKVNRPLRAGMYHDGAGLYLQVTGSGASAAKSWIYRYSIAGRAREMGLGSLVAVSLADARAKAAACRALRQSGTDPIEARKLERAQAALAAAKTVTFKDAAESYIAAHRAGKGTKSTKLWGTTLSTYAFPVIGALPVQSVDTALVLKVLEPIWTTIPETAARLRGRIESVLDYAKVRGLRDGDNPARWRGHLQHQLPARSKVRRVKHHAALPYAEIPEFMAALRKIDDSIGARALEYTILTSARTGETIGATPDELNMADKVWTVPAARMKGGKEHRVPLSARVIEILKEMTDYRTAISGEGHHTFVFPGRKGGRPLSHATMGEVLKRMERADLTVHGFRSTFRDWAAECTGYASEVVEMALAHAVGNKVEAAYRRGDLFEKRRRLMAEWATFCNTPNANERSSVVPLRSGRR